MNEISLHLESFLNSVYIRQKVKKKDSVCLCGEKRRKVTCPEGSMEELEIFLSE